jgi:hypothetical protein
MCLLGGEGLPFPGLYARFSAPSDEKVLSQKRRFAMHRTIAIWRRYPTSIKQVSVVVLKAQMGNQVLAAKVAQGILEFHQLNKNVVLGIEMRSRLW